jgi:ABC-type amino acid transport system permease subunit
MAKWLRSIEFLVELGLLIFFLLLLWMARIYPEKSRFFPMLLCTAAVILTLTSLIQGFFKVQEKRKKEKKEDTFPAEDVHREKLKWAEDVEEESEGDAGFKQLDEESRRKRVCQSLLIVFISIIIGYIGGFLLAVPFYFLAFGVLHGQKKQVTKYIIIALVITLLVYVFFMYFMGVPLLRSGWQ